MADSPRARFARNHADTLFISDIDGTLLTDDGVLRDRTRDTIRDLITNRGIFFTLCTARSYRRTKEIARALCLSIPVIVDSGSCLIDPSTDTVLWASTFDNEGLSAVVRLLEDAGAAPLVHTYMRRGLTRTIPGSRLMHARSCAGTPHMAPELPAFMVTCDASLLPGFVESDFGLNVSISATQDGRTMEVRPPQTTKGTAARRLASFRRSEKIVAFGNTISDYPLLAAANEGYVVANAPAELKRAFPPIGSNNKDAVAHWMMARLA